MKKLIALILTLICTFGLVGCNVKTDHNIKIVVPAGNQEQFVYSEEEISPLKKQISMKSIDVSDNTKIVLKAVETKKEDVSTFLQKGQPLLVDVEQDVWFKIGVSMQNPTNEDIVVCINVENVKVRIKKL